jgi:hypothetical protein
MPVRQEFRYEKGQNVNYESLVVDEAKEVDGIWVPMKVTLRSGTSAVPGVVSLFVYVVKQFEFGGVTDDDFKLAFPPGTEVVDRVAKIAYRVLENGNVEMLPLLDSDTGRVLSAANPLSVDEAAREQGVLAAVAEGPARANTLKETGAAPSGLATATPQRRAGPGVWIAAVLGMCAIATGIGIFARGRRSAAQDPARVVAAGGRRV